MFDFFNHINTHLRWQDILDISINSYLLFRFYILFRGTNVIRVLFGLAVIWFIQRIALTIGFIVSSWISQGITAAAALIVVVIFRNEIRAVLQSKNVKGILWEIPMKLVKTPVDIIADSVFEMARKRIGALIVIPGKEDLEEFLQHGIRWGGAISREMIISIFWPDNPVHDGAVILRGDEIEKVGCILPLSKQEALPSKYGTRHRAALGLSESSDALVIVVSEERGHVAVARDTGITTVDRKTLERKLKKHAGYRLQAGRPLIDEKLEIVMASILSVMFITGIWFGITRGLDTLAAYDVPIEYMNRNPSQEIVETSVNQVKLQIGGSRSLIRTINSDQLRVRIDLSEAVLGKNDISITRDKISLPPGVILKDVDPPVVDVTLDVLTEKVLPIQADWIGAMPDNLILAGASLTPDKIAVIGASQFLESVATIYTEKIPVDGLNQSGTLTVGLSINPAKLKLAEGSKNTVLITYEVKARSP